MEQIAFLKNRQFQTRFYGVLCIILLAVIGFYSYTNISKMLNMNTKIENYTNLHKAASQIDDQLDSELKTNKEENAQLIQKIEQERDYVFPEHENHTILTRSLEKFAQEIHRTKNPFNITNLQYLNSQNVEGKDYMKLPFKMTIHSSYDNFFEFLKYVENSGTLNEQSRLLDIESIIINFVKPQGSQGNTSGQNEINFNVSMNAYFRSLGSSE